MPKPMNQVVEQGAAEIAQGAGLPGQEATVEVLNRILHMELSGVMQHFHHRWMSRWLRTSRPRAIAVGQHIASLTGGTSVDVGELMEEALAGPPRHAQCGAAHEEERVDEYRRLLELVAGRSDGLEAFARAQIAADERILAELSAPPQSGAATDARGCATGADVWRVHAMCLRRARLARVNRGDHVDKSDPAGRPRSEEQG